MSKKALESLESKTPLLTEKISRLHSGSSIKGHLTSPDSLYFNGTLNGEIRLSNKLVLGEKANIKGNIYASNLTVLGKVEGDITIQGKVMFGSASSFKGKLSAKTIEVKNGAIFNAQCMLVQSSNETLKEPDLQLDENIELSPEENTISNDTPDGESKSFFSRIFQNQ